MGWENTIGNDDQAIDERWQWRMKTPKSEADSTAPSFKDVWQTINPLQHIPIVGSIYRALTGDVPSAASRAVGGMLFGGPVGMLVAGVAAAVTQASGGDPIERTVARMVGKDAPPEAEVAAVATPAEQPAAAHAKTVEPAAVGPAPVMPEKAPAPREVASAAPPAADPYARFQPKRLTVEAGNSIAQNLAALNAMQLTAPRTTTETVAPRTTTEAVVPVEPTASRPAVAAIPEKAVDRAMAVTNAAPAANTLTPGMVPNGPPQSWFSQAMIGALDRYREAGGLRPPTATKAVDTRR